MEPSSEDPLLAAQSEMEQPTLEALVHQMRFVNDLQKAYIDADFSRRARSAMGEETAPRLMREGAYKITLDIKQVYFKDIPLQVELQPPPDALKDRFRLKYDNDTWIVGVKHPASILATTMRDHVINGEEPLRFMLEYEPKPDIKEFAKLIEKTEEAGLLATLSALYMNTGKQLEIEKALMDEIDRVQGRRYKEIEPMVLSIRTTWEQLKKSQDAFRARHYYDTTFWEHQVRPEWPVCESYENGALKKGLRDPALSKLAGEWAVRYLKMCAEWQPRAPKYRLRMSIKNAIDALVEARVVGEARGEWSLRLVESFLQYENLCRRLPSWLAADSHDYKTLEFLNQLQRTRDIVLKTAQEGLCSLAAGNGTEPGTVESMLLHGARRMLVDVILEVSWTDAALEEKMLNEASGLGLPRWPKDETRVYARKIKDWQTHVEADYARLTKQGEGEDYKQTRKKLEAQMLTQIAWLMRDAPIDGLAMLHIVHRDKQMHGPYKFGLHRLYEMTPERRAQAALQFLDVLSKHPLDALALCGIDGYDTEITKAFEEGRGKLAKNNSTSTRNQGVEVISQLGRELVEANANGLVFIEQMIGQAEVRKALWPKEDIPLYFMERDPLGDQMVNPKKFKEQYPGFSTQAIQLETRMTEHGGVRDQPVMLELHCQDNAHKIEFSTKFKPMSDEVAQTFLLPLMEGAYGVPFKTGLAAPLNNIRSEYQSIAASVMDGGMNYEVDCLLLKEKNSVHEISSILSAELVRTKMRIDEGRALGNKALLLEGKPMGVDKLFKRHHVKAAQEDIEKARRFPTKQRRADAVHTYKHALFNYAVQKCLKTM